MIITKSQLNLIILELCGTTLESILRPLNYCLEEYKAFPFSFSEPPSRFRTTVQATCLLSLFRAGLLGEAETRMLQETIVSMRDFWHRNETDFAGGLQPPEKYSEDKDAWCITETPSVWSTSYVIWALLSSGYQNAHHILPSIEWLISQQNEENDGFAYQRYKDCMTTAYMTCLAIKAMRAVLGSRTILEGKQELVSTIESTIGRGLNFISECSREINNTIVFARHPNRPVDEFDWVSTIWSYRTLNQNTHPSAPNPHQLFSLLRENLSDENKKRVFWKNNAFVVEGHTKYGEQKTYFYFMPSLLIPLINLGLNPLDPLAAYFIKELKATFRKIGWPIFEYRRTELCTFSTALGLQTIHDWAVKVPSKVINNLIRENRQIYIQKEIIDQLNVHKKKYENLKLKFASLITFFPVIILLFTIPWSGWISSKNPFFIVTATLEIFLCLIGIRLFLGNLQRLWRTIVEMIGLLAGVATIIYILWSLL
jgi:hypothetical protein